MTEKEIFFLASRCGIVAWTKHDYLADKKDFREQPIDEGMDGDGACLIQFAKSILALERDRIIKAAQIPGMTVNDVIRVIRGS